MVLKVRSWPIPPLAAVYWLIPGDFNYASSEGQKVLAQLERIPEYVYDGRDVDLSLGEIKVPLNSAKQLIDTYGTYGLLYNWFPNEAQGIRLITDKPRSEFLAISDSYRYSIYRGCNAYITMDRGGLTMKIIRCMATFFDGDRLGNR